MQLTLSIPQLTPERLLRWGVFAALATPLVVWLPALVYPFITTKVFYFRMLVEAIVPLGVYVALRRSGTTRMATRNNAEAPHPGPPPQGGREFFRSSVLSFFCSAGPIGLALLIWSATLVLTTFTGVDWSRSFFSTTERMMGVFTFLHFAAYFFLLRFAQRGLTQNETRTHAEDAFRPVLWITVLIGIAVTAIKLWAMHSSTYRPFFGDSGTLGNRLYFANFLLFPLGFSLVLFVRTRARRVRVFAGGALAFLLFGFLKGNSRGAFLGLIAGVGMLCVILAIKGSERNLQIFKFTKLRIPIIGNFANWQIGKFDPVRWGAIGFLSLLIAGGFALVTLQDHPFVQKIPTVNKLALTQIGGGTVATRVMAWQVAWRAFKEKPFFGWGPENFHYPFSLFYNPQFLRFGPQETWFDRSHNAYMDALSMTGMVGTLAYLGIFAVAIFLLLRTLRARQITNNQSSITNIEYPISNIPIPYLEPAVALSLLVAYLVQNLFIFDHASSLLMLIVLLVWIEQLAGVKISDLRFKISDRVNRMASSRIIVASVSLLSVVLLVWGNLLPLRANMAVRDALPVMKRQGFEAAKDAYARALLLYSPHHAETIELFGKEFIERSNGGLALEALQNPAFPDIVKWAVGEMEAQLARHPLDARLGIMIGQLWNTLLPQDKSAISQSDAAFTRAAPLSPTRQEIYLSWGRARFVVNDLAGAKEKIQTAIALDPAIADPHWLLGVILETEADHAGAWAAIRRARIHGYQFPDAEQILFAGVIAERAGRTKEALALYEEGIARFAHPYLYAKAAAAASWGGEAYKEKAREYARKAVELDPNLKEQLKPLLE